MNLVHVPANPALVVDLDKVAYMEAAEVGQAGQVLFGTATLDVTVRQGWAVYVGMDGEDFAWSGITHQDQQDAMAELTDVASRAQWYHHDHIPRGTRFEG